MPEHSIEGTEHDFTGMGEDWERRVFQNAIRFRLIRYWGRGGRDDAFATTFPDAMMIAAQGADDPQRPGSRILVYAITESGRFTLIPEERWPMYLEVWNEIVARRVSNVVSKHASDKS